jgi:hypothetical protein
VHNLAVPVTGGLERNEAAAMLDGALENDVRVDANELAVVIGVAVTGSRGAGLDVAHHRARVAADLVGGSRVSHHLKSLQSGCAKRQRNGLIVRIRMILRVSLRPVKRRPERNLPPAE